MKKGRKKIWRRRKPDWLEWLFWTGLGICLLVPTLISALALSKIILAVNIVSMAFLSLVVGVIVYALFHTYLYQPLALYVTAHELTHAFFALLFGIRVKKIKISAGGGYVQMSYSNFIIDLAPYFFPFYAIFWAIIGLILGLEKDYYYSLIYFFGIGICLGFHYLLSWEIIKIEQPDFVWTGKIFALVFSLLVNLIILSFFLAVIFRNDISLELVFANYRWAYNLFRI